MVARSRSSVVPHSRPLRSSAQAFPGKKQRACHRARFPRPGCAQGHEEELQQEGSLRRLVAQAVGNLAAWRKGRIALHTSQRSAHTVASISLPDLGPWDAGWEFPSQEALANALCKAATKENWTDQARRVMLFITRHTQQAVNVSAAESARAWRQWAKEACQGSAGAGHPFTKTGIDNGKQGTLAGAEQLAKQMETWLPLWLDGRRAAAKQLADQEDWNPLPRPSLEEVDDVCKTTRARLVWDINPKAVLQLLVELRVRFIDLLMAFEAKLVNQLCWAHMMVLRPKPSGEHRTIGLTVAPLRVLSRVRRPLAQKWENEHDAAYFWGCQGKACDRAAWAHSVVVAAAKGRQQSAASLLLDLAKFFEHIGHDHLWEEHDKTRFPRRLLAQVGALPQKVGGSSRQTSVPRSPSSRLQWRHHSSQIDVGHSPGNGVMLGSQHTGSGMLSTPFRGTWLGLLGWFRSSRPKRPGSWWKAFEARHLLLSKGKSKVFIDGTDKLKQGPSVTVGGARHRRVPHGTQRQGRSAAGQATTRPRCGAIGKGGQAHETH